MTQSDEQGFHQSSIEMFTIKTRQFHEGKQSKVRNKGAYLYRSPLSLHYQQQLYEYPKHLDHFFTPKASSSTRNNIEEHCNLIQNDGEMPILLSQFFPRRLNCVYNRFGENLILKRDTTIVIRNIASRIRNDQVITFHDRIDPPPTTAAITFNSNFEGGNLHCVFRERGSTCYYLLLQNDINTHGYNIWFHFNVKAHQSGTFQFVVVNLAKEVKFSEEIMLLTCSSKSNQYSREIGFDCRETKFRHCESSKRFWSITFSYSFEAGQDVYISLCPPYTFSKLMRLIKQITQPFYQNISITAEIVGKTELGNYVPCLKIAAKEKASKKCIIITARQHPCQTMGSFICQQLIKGITDNSPLAHELCETFTFFIFPMVNPDGVIHGNSRTNLMGYDINRSWDLGLLNETAEALHIWSYILKIIEQGYQINWSFDLHGHSKQLGYFAYFCEENESTTVLNHNLAARPPYYQAEKCGFSLNKSKIESIRGQLFSKLQVGNAVTIETSYYGFRNQNGILVQFNQHHFQQISTQILESLLQTDKILRNKTQKQQILQNISKFSRQAQKKIHRNYQPHQIDSDSDPEQDYLRKQERSEVKGGSLLKENNKFRTKTQHFGRGQPVNQEEHPKYRNFGRIKQGRFGSTSLNKSSTIQKEKQRNLTFYAGRRTLSPKANNNTIGKGKFRRKINVQRRFKTQIPTHVDDQEDQQYIKKSYELKKTHLQEQSKKLKTYVGGFRTCYEVLELRTIVYPTAASSGLEFQNSLKSKKEIIKEIRGKELCRGNQRRKLSETFYNQIKKQF